MPTYHKTKADLVNTLWEKMKATGADEGLSACVSGMTLHLLPGPDQEDGYDKLVDAIVECAWKRGVHDCLTAIELGAIAGIVPDSAAQGQN